VIEPDGTVCVRLIYDHRVLDGAMAARALGKLEDVLNGPILNELDEMTRVSQAAA
jgi:pyruvate/2-oxoglutarate dehydrogenase complex dihydrolipoamide acyltransferase (E2) component